MLKLFTIHTHTHLSPPQMVTMPQFCHIHTFISANLSSLQIATIPQFPPLHYHLDPFAFFQYVNPAYENAFGYTCEELQGRDIRDLTRSDRNMSDHSDVMDAQVRKGKVGQNLEEVSIEAPPRYGMNRVLRKCAHDLLEPLTYFEYCQLTKLTGYIYI